MEGNFQRNDSITSVGGNYRGCMCGILRILDYRHLQSVKKLLPHKKHSTKQRRVTRNGSPKSKLIDRNLGEVSMDADAETMLNANSVPVSKRSGKTHTKSRLPGVNEGEEHYRRWILSFPLQSWLHRTNPVDNLEPSDSYLGQIDTDEIPQPNRDVSDQQLDDCVDILKIFKDNKEFFLRILQDPDACKSHVHGLRNSNIQVRLTKSRSFPLPNSSQARHIRPSTLKHKQNEVWLFLNREQSKFQKDNNVNSMTANNDTSGSAKNHGWNQLVINRLSVIKQKIKRALKESKSKNSHSAVEAEYQKLPFGGRTSIDRLEITIGQDGKKSSGLDEDLRKQRLEPVRRTASLNESLDRYAQLFESTSGKETKYSHSISLRVTSEEKVPFHAQKSCRRNLSLPDLDFLASLSNGTSRGSFRLEMPIKTIADHGANKNRDNQNTGPESSNIALDVDNTQLLDSIVERSGGIAHIEYSADLTTNESEKEILGTDDILEDANKRAKRENSSCQEEEIRVTKDIGLELPQPSQGSIIETCFSDHLSEGLDERETSILQQNRNTKALNQDKTEDRNRSLENRPDSTENLDFSYIRDLLELSGFIHNEETTTWHSLDQPLSPSVFKQLEDMYHHENEIVENICNHQLLFDLVNATLVEMNEKSDTYFPKEFSLGLGGRLVHPMPKGERLPKEVWKRMCRYLSLRPELDKSLDDVVARDFARNDGWMDLEWEMEMVALELEDIIFDQLLDEVLCS